MFSFALIVDLFFFCGGGGGGVGFLEYSSQKIDKT